MTENRFTKPNRETVVTRLDVVRTSPTDPLHPRMKNPPPPLTEKDFENDVWQVAVTTRTGFDRENMLWFYARSEAESNDLEDKFAVGTNLPQGTGSYPVSFRYLYEKGNGGFSFIFSPDHNDFGILYPALEGAGVIGKGYLISEEVYSWFSDDYIEWLKNEFEDNWSIVAEFEYCSNNFPSSSLAYIASQILFNHFIICDDFSVGYLYGEFELINGGAEDIAKTAMETRKHAGTGGGKASATAREKRLRSFLSEIEKLADLYPRINEQPIVDQAFQNAIAADEKLWSQGRGRQAEYEIELRSREEFRRRYYKIFNQNA